MKRSSLVLLLLCLIISGCSSDIAAVYYRRDQAPFFSEEDLKSFRQIITVDQFNLLEEKLQQLQKPAAVWIDKNAADTVPDGWLKNSPQREYPIVLLGYNAPVYIFGTLLPVDFPWPQGSIAETDLPQGYSVWKQTGEKSGIIKGYNPPVTVKQVLEVTNRLLENQNLE